MVKGRRTELTYKVKLYRYMSYWMRAKVYAPVLKRPFFGLLPARLCYELVYNGDDCEQRLNFPVKPEEIRAVAENAVTKYEAYKLAWEQHEATVA